MIRINKLKELMSCCYHIHLINYYYLIGAIFGIPSILLIIILCFAYFSLFSRYAVCAFPAIYLVNETTMVGYRGTKDLMSLIVFYKETTYTIIILAIWF